MVIAVLRKIASKFPSTLNALKDNYSRRKEFANPVVFKTRFKAMCTDLDSKYEISPMSGVILQCY